MVYTVSHFVNHFLKLFRHFGSYTIICVVIRTFFIFILKLILTKVAFQCFFSCLQIIPVQPYTTLFFVFINFIPGNTFLNHLTKYLCPGDLNPGNVISFNSKT